MTKNLTSMEEAAERPDAVDSTDGSVVYLGYALPGTEGTDWQRWKIRRAKLENSLVTFMYPYGSKDYEFSFDEREMYEYKFPR
jgi:hypothetical protein